MDPTSFGKLLGCLLRLKPLRKIPAAIPRAQRSRARSLPYASALAPAGAIATAAATIAAATIAAATIADATIAAATIAAAAAGCSDGNLGPDFSKCHFWALGSPLGPQAVPGPLTLSSDYFNLQISYIFQMN